MVVILSIFLIILPIIIGIVLGNKNKDLKVDRKKERRNLIIAFVILLFLIFLLWNSIKSSDPWGLYFAIVFIGIFPGLLFIIYYISKNITILIKTKNQGKD